MRLDDREQRKSYEKDFYQTQAERKAPIRGILIYEQARKKLNISEKGSLYRQKWFSYLPIFGPTCSFIYANYCLGKIKCLRRRDEVLFGGAKVSSRCFAALIWPLIFLAFWTLLSYFVCDFSSNIGLVFDLQFGSIGSYAANWNNVFIEPLKSTSDVGIGFSIFFSGLAKIFFMPFLNGPNFAIRNIQVGSNIIFIICMLILTIINPVNIFNSIVFNMVSLRFVIVYETSNIYRYRNT